MFNHLWNKVTNLLPNFEKWQIHFYKRTENLVADMLAKMVHPTFTVFTTYLPHEVREVVTREKQRAVKDQSPVELNTNANREIPHP